MSAITYQINKILTAVVIVSSGVGNIPNLTETEKQHFERIQKFKDTKEKIELHAYFKKYYEGKGNELINMETMRERGIKDGVLVASSIGRYLRAKIVSTEMQKQELNELIVVIRDYLEKLEQSAVDNETIVETDYEVIDKQQTAYEKEKAEWQNLLAELENKLGSLGVDKSQVQEPDSFFDALEHQE
ncbi:10395_t:CDS:1 [Ambispora gerdemannii]|uniref:10395_t:CDS:1 n=1 Tax=Ambispora gerdemannii TaxID=144530 RepID=A0A9N8VEU8_9GLOM|nr:10395_t:CDS:1 [Ambispora gerdemannii]